MESTISELLPSLEGREKLYSALSSFPDREGIYVELRLSSDQIEQAELKWHLLHEQYEPPLTQLDSPRRSSGPFSPQQIIDLSKSMGAAAVGAEDEMMDSLKRLSPCNPGKLPQGKLQSMLSRYSSEAFKDFLSGSEIPRNKKEEYPFRGVV